MSTIDAILGYPVIAAVITAVVTFVGSTIYSYIQHKKKINAAINLIYLHAKAAEKSLDKWDDFFEEVNANIKKGNPYGEPDKNFTPLIFYTEEDNLSFDQTSEICRYLEKSGQTALLEYFMCQAIINAIVCQINTDFFRSLPQVRKMKAWEYLGGQHEDLQKKTKNLIGEIDKRSATEEIDRLS